jgi:hypothetical protein
VNVVNFYFDEAGNSVNGGDYTSRFEGDAVLLDLLKRVKWFIHEHTVNFGMFNTSRAEPKNIYQFGMAPEFDVSIPNFNDIFILFQELVNFDAEIRAQAQSDYAAQGCLSDTTQAKVKEMGEKRIAHFLHLCSLTDVPEFGSVFESTWRNIRYFWSGNHVSNRFTGEVFNWMNRKYFNIELTTEFWNRVMGEDMYSSPCSPVTKFDIEAYGLMWPVLVEELRVP